ncbi:MAG: ATP-binding protein [Chloroflexota bacterium]
MNIKTLLARGPGPVLEFMPEPGAEALAEQIVAFANSIGGTIVVGMDASGGVAANSADFLEPILANALRMCEPPFRGVDLPEWRIEETPRGPVATLLVKPTPYQTSVQGRYVYVRSGRMNIRLSPEKAGAEPPARTLKSFEEETVAGATQEDLDEGILEEYGRNLIKRGPRGESLERPEMLREAGALDPSGVPTVAGLLLFGKHPQRFLPQVGVVIVRFRGTSMYDVANSNERYSRRVEVVGPTARIVEETWRVLYEEIHADSYTNGLRREQKYLYPLEAVREAVVNAICHRDYSIQGQRVEVRLFDDRMEILSPGGLPGHITVENLRNEHYSRNPRLVRGLFYWGYIEELGQGVDIIYAAMEREHHPPPEFRDSGRGFTVVLSNAVDAVQLEFADQLNERQVRALRFLVQNERITNREYRDLCGDVSSETLRLDLRDLVEKGILLKIGDKRGTYYVRK